MRSSLPLVNLFLSDQYQSFLRGSRGNDALRGGKVGYMMLITEYAVKRTISSIFPLIKLTISSSSFLFPLPSPSNSRSLSSYYFRPSLFFTLDSFTVSQNGFLGHTLTSSGMTHFENTPCVCVCVFVCYSYCTQHKETHTFPSDMLRIGDECDCSTNMELP